MLPRKWKDSIVPLQWAEPRRRVPGRSHKHSLIIPSRAFDSRNTLKNKQPINLSFLVCLGIQSSNELAPWRSQTPHCTPSTVPPHSSAPPPHRRMQSVPAKALGSGGPDGPNEGCPGQTQGARNWKQRILVWPQEPPPPMWLQAQTRTVWWCDWVRRQSHQSASFWAKLTATAWERKAQFQLLPSLGYLGGRKGSCMGGLWVPFCGNIPGRFA